MALTREQFEGIRPTVKEVPVYGTENTVFIRTISAKTRDGFDDRVRADKDDPTLPAVLVCLCLCDAEGTNFYQDGPGLTEAVERILASDIPAPTIEQLFFECRDLNRMGSGAIEEAAKNSETTPGDSSSSA